MKTVSALWQKAISAAKSPLGRYSILMFFAFRVGDFSMLATKFLLGRQLTNFDFGAFEPFLSVLTIAGLPVAAASQAASRALSQLSATDQLSRRAATIRSLILFALFGIVVSCGATWALRGLIMSRLHLENPALMYTLMGLIIMAWAMPVVTSILQGCQKYSALAWLSMLYPVFTLFITCGVAFVLSLDLHHAMVARLLAGIGAVCLAVLLFVRPLMREAGAWQAVGIMALARATLPMVAFMCCTGALMHFDRLFVRNFLVEDSGGYGAVMTLGQIPLWLSGPVVLVLFPMASAEHAVGKSLDGRIRDMFITGITIMAISVAALLVITGPIMRIWNPAFVPYSHFVWQYAVGMGFDSMIQFLGSIELARHRYRGFAWMGLITLAYCATMYLLRGVLDLQMLLLMFVVVRVVILVGMVVITRGQSRDAVAAAAPERA